jgi:hypothetical protein
MSLFVDFAEKLGCDIYFYDFSQTHLVTLLTFQASAAASS